MNSNSINAKGFIVAVGACSRSGGLFEEWGLVRGGGGLLTICSSRVVDYSRGGSFEKGDSRKYGLRNQNNTQFQGFRSIRQTPKM